MSYGLLPAAARPTRRHSYSRLHAPATLPSHDQARIAANHLKAFYGARGIDVLDVARQQAYVDHRYNRDIALATISRELGVLRAALYHAQRANLALNVPRIYDVPPSEPRDRWLIQEEFGDVVKACKSPHIRLFVLLAAATAGRPEAVLELTWRAIDFAAGVTKLNPAGRAQTAKRRPIVKMSEEMRTVLLEACKARKTEYVIEYGKYPVKSIQKGFRAAAALAGFQPGEIVPYTLWHTAATWMAQAGVPLWEIAGFLGHSDTRMVERHYAHHHPDFQQRATAALQEKLAGVQLAPQLHPRLAHGARQKAKAKKHKTPRFSWGYRQWWARQGLNL
jgi:integrase